MSRSKMKPPLLLLLLLLLVGHVNCVPRERDEGGKNEDSKQGTSAAGGIIELSPELNKGNQEGKNTEGPDELTRGRQIYKRRSSPSEYGRKFDDDDDDEENDYMYDEIEDDDNDGEISDEDREDDDQDVEEEFDEENFRREPPRRIRNKQYGRRRQGKPARKEEQRNNRRKPPARRLKQELNKFYRYRRDVGSHDIVKRAGGIKAAVKKVQKKLSDLKRNRDEKNFMNDSPESIVRYENPTYLPKEYEDKYGKFSSNPIYEGPSLPMTQKEKSDFLGLKSRRGVGSHDIVKRVGGIKGAVKKVQKKLSGLRRNGNEEYERLMNDYENPTYDLEEYEDEDKYGKFNSNPIYEGPSSPMTQKEKSDFLGLKSRRPVIVEKGRKMKAAVEKNFSDLKNKFKKKNKDKKFIRNPTRTNSPIRESGTYEPLDLDMREEDWTYNRIYERPSSNRTLERKREFVGLESSDKEKRGLRRKIKDWFRKIKNKKNNKPKNSKESNEEEYERRYDSGRDNGGYDDGYDDSYGGDYDDEYDNYQRRRERYKRGEVDLLERALRSMAVFTSRLLDDGKETSITTTLDTKEKKMNEEPPEEDIEEEEEEEGDEYENVENVEEEDEYENESPESDEYEEDYEGESLNDEN